MSKAIKEQITEQTTIKTINVDEAIHEFLTEQVNRTAQFVVSNLFSIAQIAVVDFGVVPSFDDVFIEAATIAQGPELYCFDRDLYQESRDHLDDAADREEPGNSPRSPDTRKGLSRKQYERLMNCAEFVLKNSSYLRALKANGYETSATREDMYVTARDDAHTRLNNWKNQQDNIELARRTRLREIGKHSADTLGV